MGTNPCHLCSTPDAKITALGISSCAGCGDTPITLLMDHLADKRTGGLKDVLFSDATFQYERSPFATRLSFGEWLAVFKLNLIGKP